MRDLEDQSEGNLPIECQETIAHLHMHTPCHDACFASGMPVATSVGDREGYRRTREPEHLHMRARQQMSATARFELHSLLS